LIKEKILSIKYFVFLIFCSYFLQYIINNVFNFQFLEVFNNAVIIKSLGYFESGDYFRDSNTLSLGFFIRILLVLFLIIKRDKIKNKVVYFDKLLFIYVISIFVLIIFNNLTIFTSVAIYFKFFEVILIPLLIGSLNGYPRFIFYSFLLIYLYFSFYKLINNPLETDFYPYKSILY
jgi:hypothetical protein